MKNKVMLFSSNGMMLKEISNNNINVINGWNVNIGDKGEIKCQSNVSFMKKEGHKPLDKERLECLEVYVYNTLVFKGYGFYCDSRHSAPYIFTEIEGEVFEININGSAQEHLTVLKDCE